MPFDVLGFEDSCRLRRKYWGQNLSPWLGDIVDNPMTESTISPGQWLKIWPLFCTKISHFVIQQNIRKRQGYNTQFGFKAVFRISIGLNSGPYYAFCPNAVPDPGSRTNKDSCGSVAEFIDPWLGNKVNNVIGLSYRHARLHGWPSGTTTVLPGMTLSPSQGSMNSATDQTSPGRYNWMPHICITVKS